MFILASGGQSYARLQFNTGPKAAIRIPVEVDFTPPFDWTDEDAWEAEYLTNVIPERLEQPQRGNDDHDDWLLGVSLLADDEEAARADN